MSHSESYNLKNNTDRPKPIYEKFKEKNCSHDIYYELQALRNVFTINANQISVRYHSVK